MSDGTIDFVLHGTQEAVSSRPGETAVRRVRVAALRGAGTTVSVSATPGEDVVRLKLLNGPELVLHPDSARTLLDSQTRRAERSANGKQSADPQRLAWGNTGTAGTRSGTGNVLVDFLEVVRPELTAEALAGVAAKGLRALIDDQVDEGLYALSAGALPNLKTGATQLTAPPSLPERDGRLLVLLHGTFSSTAGTFGKLWSQHPGRVSRLFAAYDGHVYGFDHPTLGADPIDNARSLVERLPHGAKLHLLSHSRGGLVAETLARACAGRPLTHEELTALTDARRDAFVELWNAARDKGLQVERVVRVACPTRGTLLASKRLDAYVSALKWGLELAQIPVAPGLIGFLHQIAKQRHEPETFPGLAAMLPDSPLVRFLHATQEPIPGTLRVVAGDVEGDSVWSWIKTLVSDAFYWTDNDFVVQTRSMYGGVPRVAKDATFFLDRGGGVSHFNYFHNEITACAITDALLDQGTPRSFEPIGHLSYEGRDSSGMRAATRAAAASPRPDRPAVFVLPGILGSNLKVEVDGQPQRIWVSARLLNGFDRLAWSGDGSNVEPDGYFAPFYEDLCEYLAETHEVLPFAFDWRKPLRAEAQRLAVELEKALNVRQQTNRPVRILAHSMGGLLARTLELENRALWERFIEQDGARFVMLGTPNSGAWSPMRVLTGDDLFGNSLAFVGSLFDGTRARGFMGEFPGFLQLQANLIEDRLGEQRTWQELAAFDLARLKEQSPWHAWLRRSSDWGIPSLEALEKATELRRELDEQRPRLERYRDRKKIVLVVGTAKWTAEGYERGEGGIEYVELRDGGDGTVLHSSAVLPGVPTYQLAANHGALPKTRVGYLGYLKLLEDGEVPAAEGLALKPFTAAAQRRGAALDEAVRRRTRPAHDALFPRAPYPEHALSPLLLEPSPRADTSLPALRITVTNGNLRFVAQPLLLGHYRSTRLTGTEDAMDQLVGNAMGQSVRAGNYPDAIGTHQVFVNRYADPDNEFSIPHPEAVIVVGLGEEGELSAEKLAGSVEKAVIAYAQRLIERPAKYAGVGGAAPTPASSFELATTLIGSGGARVSAGASAQAVARGVRAANGKLLDVGWPVVGHLTFVELYLERAAEAWHALDALRTTLPGSIELAEQVANGTGALLRQVDANYRGAGYDFVTVTHQTSDDGLSALSYALDTRRARSEVRGQVTQGKLVAGFIRAVSNHDHRNDAIGHALFRLLVPLELEPFLTGTERLLLQLDRTTAQIPWELLHAEGSGQDARTDRPWAIRCKLLRKLRVEEFRETPAGAGDDGGVLVIGAPKTPPEYGALPGAVAEARAVTKALGSALGIRVEALLEPEGTVVISSLLGPPYRIVHIAGHGDQAEEKRPGGVVLDDGNVVSAVEIRNMRRVPELVFVNCCHLAELPKKVPLAGQHPAFAAGVAEELIKIGVRCVVAAGWAVDDDAAKLFAQTFYEALLEGERFVEATARAREVTWREHPESNTWAAYQCYGDPDWTFVTRREADRLPESTARPVSAAGLENALRTLAVEFKYRGAESKAKVNPDELHERDRERVMVLERRYATALGTSGEVAEAFGDAYSEAGAFDDATRWYERALAADDASASQRALQQYANLLVRRAAERVETAKRTGSDGPALHALVEEAKREITRALGLLDPQGKLLGSELRRDVETLSMLGSAYKRLAFIEALQGRPIDASLGSMETYYRRALHTARKHELPELYYPGLNAVFARLLQALTRDETGVLDPDDLAAIKRNLEVQMETKPDFFPAVSAIELRIYRALDQRDLASEVEALITELDRLYCRVRSPRQWASVRDQARIYDRYYARNGAAAERAAMDRLVAKLESFAPPAAGS